jgi:hypothetical protein
MKSINLWTALILCSLFLFSCANLRIEKRRYNKGLHIHSSSKSRTASSSRETALEKNRAESQPEQSSYTTVSSFDKKKDSRKSSSTALTEDSYSKEVSAVQLDDMNPKKDATTQQEGQNSIIRTDHIKTVQSVHESKNASKLVSNTSTVKPTHNVGSVFLSVFGVIFLAVGTLVLIWAVLFFGWVGLYGVLIALGILILGIIMLVISKRIMDDDGKSD